jgi:hypothetical protein
MIFYSFDVECGISNLLTPGKRKLQKESNIHIFHSRLIVFTFYTIKYYWIIPLNTIEFGKCSVLLRPR